MHDPMVETFTIRRPWPKVSRQTRKRKARFRGAFWYVAGVELYWPSLITVWHVEPDGQDAGAICKPSTWRRHPHHWRIQFHPWQHFRRWAFTRCTWCGGKSRKGDYVNTGYGWEPDRKPAHWWQSERGLFHGDCLSVHHAHRTCVCSLADGGPWANGKASGDPYGNCATCGGFRRMSTGGRADYEVHVATTVLMQGIPVGHRNATVMSEVKRLWAEHRANTPPRRTDL